MAYMDIRMAYNDLRYGKITQEDILALYREMPDKRAAYQYGDTLLHLAAANLHVGAVQYLLAEGCDPNAVNENGETPLWSVALCRELNPALPQNAIVDVTTALLDAGASPVKKDGNGNWCYLAAAKNGNGEFIAALHGKGVRITRADAGGNNGLHLLIESLWNPINDFAQAEKRCQKSLAENASPSVLENQQRLLEEYRAKMEYRLALALQGVAALLDAGVDPEDQNGMGETAHVLAERRGAKKIGALLRGEISGEAEQGDGGGEAALREAAGGMNLLGAVGKRDHEAVRALAALGADVNEIGDIYGYGEGTPLAMALRSCDYPTAALLLELGADPNCRAGDGTTPVSWLSVSPTGPLQQVFDDGWPAQTIDAMVAAGLDINTPVNDVSDTLLLWALQDHPGLESFVTRETLRWCIVNAALAHGADVNRSNLYGQTPLMLASAGNPGYNMRMADELQLLLLEKGADVAAQDKTGNTPLLYAAQNSGAAAREMAENLFDYGDPMAAHVNNEGKSALDYATAQNNEMLVKLLLNHL